MAPSAPDRANSCALVPLSDCSALTRSGRSEGAFVPVANRAPAETKMPGAAPAFSRSEPCQRSLSAAEYGRGIGFGASGWPHARQIKIGNELGLAGNRLAALVPSSESSVAAASERVSGSSSAEQGRELRHNGGGAVAIQAPGRRRGGAGDPIPSRPWQSVCPSAGGRCLPRCRRGRVSKAVTMAKRVSMLED